MPHAFRVVVADFLDEPLDEERRILGEIAEVVALGAGSEEELAGRIEDADAVMLYHFAAIRAATIARLARCRLIVRCGVGIDNVDAEAAARRGIPVANVPDYGTEEVADSAIGMLLALSRGIHRLNSLGRRSEGAWSYSEAVPLRRLRGRVLGIVGCGRIGSATARRAQAHGMDVAIFDPYLADGWEKALGVRRMRSLEGLLEVAHVLSLHCPLTAETRRLIDAPALERLPEGAILVNTARGGVVDTGAVLAALERGRLAGAALDVLPEEPPSAADPLIRAWRDPSHPAHDRLIVNPHAAFYCEEGLLEIRTKASENVRRALTGEPIRNVVNGIGSTAG